MSFNTQTIKRGNVEAMMEITSVANTSLSIDYSSFLSGETEEIVAFVEDQIHMTLNYLLRSYSTVKFYVTALCDMQREDGIIDNMARVNVKKSIRVYRHAASRMEIVKSIMMRLFNPKQYQAEYGDVEIEGDNSGSMFSMVQTINSISLNFITPLEWVANQLEKKYQLVAGHRLNHYVTYLPYNKNPWCFMLCLHNEFAPNDDFTEWFREHNLARFYQGDHFLIDSLPDIENELKVSINVYNRVGNNEIELYYRSGYHHHENIVNILVMGLNYFEHKITKVKASEQDRSIESTKEVKDHDFLNRGNFHEFINTRRAHAVTLNPSWFRTASKAKNTSVCRYCTNLVKSNTLEGHEANCLAHHQNSGESERMKNFVNPSKMSKIFRSFRSLWQVPFVTYDWETYLDENKNHIPFSYSLCYTNIFHPAESKIMMKCNKDDPKELIQDFIKDCKTLTVHHHDVVQSVHVAIDKPVLTQEIKEKGCPWCLQPYEEKNQPEYNHTHFQDDNLNEHLNTYVCMKCNRAAMLRNIPLKFFAHNATRYDHNLFMADLLNADGIMNEKFISKNESRFSEATMGFKLKEDDFEWNQIHEQVAKYKMSFNDSRLLLSGSLKGLVGAWISKENPNHMKTLKALLGNFYQNLPEESIEAIAQQSFKKQVFPYEALSQHHLLEATEELPREMFKDTFKGEDISEGEYREYQDANAVLKAHIPNYTFQDYHDYYLLLDVVLLAMVLRNYQAVCHESSGLNPLMNLSTSSSSFNALLYHNLHEKDIPEIKLLNVDEGRFIKSSVHGGFTHIFNRENLRGENDYTMYQDMTSLYPSVMSGCKLPYEFKKWLDLEAFGNLGALLQHLEKKSEKYYFFVEADIKALAPEFQKRVSLYPMFPETQVIKASDYSPDQHHRYQLNNGGPLKNQEINTVSFYPKKAYVTSWSYLKQAIEVGYEVEKITKVAVFRQDYVLKSYIDKQYQDKLDGTVKKLQLEKQKSELAAQGEKTQSISAEIEAVKSRIAIAKLRLNAIYGFCLVNVENHSEAQLIDINEENEAKIQKQASSLRFKSMIKVGNKVVISRMKSSFSFDYPLHIGSAILFESKLMMARYIFALSKWIPKISPELEIHPCFTDTDSYCLSIKNFKKHFGSIDEYTYRFNKEVYQLFDTSYNTPEFQMPETHNQLSHLTNETKNIEIERWVGIASKAYSYDYTDGKTKKQATKGKGISEALQAHCLNFDLYQSIVDGSILEDYSKEKYSVGFNDFRAKKFNVATVNVKKCYTTLVDLKSFCPKNGTKNYIFGSKDHLDQLQ